MAKENRTTADALLQLANAASCPVHAFGIAGTKDRRAVTVQQVTARILSKEGGRGTGEAAGLMEVARRLSRVNGKWTNDGSRVRVGHFELADRPLTLADSCGNAFVVVLRGLHLRAASTDGRHGEEAGEVAAAAGCDEGEIKRVCAEAVDKICTSGFVNYFGLQRFGTNVHVPTHAIGGSLLCRKYVDALVGVLSPRQAGLKPAVARALQAFEATVDAKAAIKLLPKRGAAAPHRLLTAFSDAVADGMPREQAAVAALRRLPRRQLLMYVNALQALAFNRAASRRLRGDNGLDPQRPVAGDLVGALPMEQQPRRAKIRRRRRRSARAWASRCLHHPTRSSRRVQHCRPTFAH